MNYENSMTHSERLNDFTQYLWGDILEDQQLSQELIVLLRDAGQNLEKAEKLLIESEPEHNGKVISNYLLISKDLAKKLLDMVNSDIKQYENAKTCSGKAPDSLYKMRDELSAVKGI